MLRTMIIGGIAAMLATAVLASDASEDQTAKAAWRQMVEDSDQAYAVRDRAILKIDDTVYLEEGQTAWLMRHENTRVHYLWSMQPPEDWTVDGESYAVLMISYGSESAMMRVVNTAANLGHIEMMRQMAEQSGIEMPPMAVAQEYDMLTYHEENESFEFDEGVQLTAHPTQMSPGETGLRATVFNQNHPEAEHFEGLVWYDYNPDMVIEARFEPMDEFVPETFQTSRGWYKEFQHVGHAVFSLNGEELRMPLYGFTTNPAEITDVSAFFTDAMSGTETYGVGRYLDVAVEEGSFPPETVTIDFNYAYNPLCARSEYYNCPYAEYDIPGAVPAGEMNPPGH